MHLHRDGVFNEELHNYEHIMDIVMWNVLADIGRFCYLAAWDGW